MPLPIAHGLLRVNRDRIKFPYAPGRGTTYMIANRRCFAARLNSGVSSQMNRIALIIICLFSLQSASAENQPSTCYGTPKDGRLENGWQLPSSGKNFEAYSSLS